MNWLKQNWFRIWAGYLAVWCAGTARGLDKFGFELSEIRNEPVTYWWVLSRVTAIAGLVGIVERRALWLAFCLLCAIAVLLFFTINHFEQPAGEGPFIVPLISVAFAAVTWRAAEGKPKEATV